MLKMADQGRSDLYVAFTMILCGINFSVWSVIKLIFTDLFQIASLSTNFLSDTHMSSGSEVINTSNNLRGQRIMVKTTKNQTAPGPPSFG